jgi:molybdopterin/thiamine biosynthesis adenylyltransferase
VLHAIPHRTNVVCIQIRLWGVEAQQRMQQSKTLICGLRGVHIEAAKNLILAGISACIQDSGVVEAYDLSSQFFFSEADIGRQVSLVTLSSTLHACVNKCVNHREWMPHYRSCKT